MIVLTLGMLYKCYGVNEMADKNTYTNGLGEYPYTERVANEEKFVGKRYRLGNEEFDTIGYGHQISNEASYSTLAEELGIKDKEHPTKEEATKLLKYDIDIRRHHMLREYPNVDQGLRDTLLNVRFQFSPQMFDKHFGAALKNKDTEAIKGELLRLGKVFEQRKMSGVLKRWKKVIVDIEKWEASKKEVEDNGSR